MMQVADRTLIDAVDQHDQVVGAVERGTEFARRVNFRVVHGFVFSSRGELLLQQIAPQRPRHPLRWGSSVAGYVLAGESYDGAIHRKVSQELGLPALPVTYFGKTAMEDEGCTKFIALYTAQSYGPCRLDVSQIARVEWFRLDAIAAERRRDPTTFTPTLLHLLDFFLAGQGAPGGLRA
jgi:isopentenyldiphosphate isomerase